MPPPIDIGQLIDEGRWSGYQKWLIGLVAMTIVFDGIDNQLLGIVIPTVMKDWGVARSAFAPVVSLGYFGMMAGGLIAGVAGDRLGRRTALLASMAVFGVMTVIAAAVDSPSSLGILRLLAGVGLGGAMPNAAALAAEYVPRRSRPDAVTVTIVCVPLGGTLAGLLGIRLLPIVGWRMLFVLGGLVPLAAAIVLRVLLPESPRFLARHPSRWRELADIMPRFGHRLPAAAPVSDGTAATAARASVRSLFLPDWRGDTLALWGAFFFCLLSVYLGFSWLTSLLTGAGFDPATANTGITAFNLGGVAGALAGGVAIQRYGSRASMLVMTAIAIAGAVTLSAMPIAPAAGVTAVIAMLALTGGAINGVQTTMYALAAHVYPGPVRATGVGTAVAVGRIGAVLTGYVGTWAIDYRGTTSFFGVIAGTMAVTFVALALVRRHVPRGRALV
jgi:AAHS family 4-hydroxybenzoate transporter-like MFS transporter